MILSAFERTVARRYLSARRGESFIAVVAGLALVGIALGVAVLIIVMSVMNGFRGELINRILGLNGHINVYSASGQLYDYDVFAGVTREAEGVIRVTPILEQQALITVAGNASGAVVRGLRSKDLEQNTLLYETISETQREGFTAHHVMIGQKMAERLKLNVGNELTLMIPQGQSTPFGTIPRAQRFTVGAIFNVGMHEYDNNFLYMPLADAQRFFSMGNSVTALEVVTKDPEAIAPIKADIATRLAGQARITDWQQSNSSFFNALKVERNVMFIILVLIIAIAAFNIVSSLFILVKDKSRDIAILRTMGASRRSILKIFMTTGASIGVVGTLSGLVLGLLITLNLGSIQSFLEAITGAELFSSEIYFLSQLPAKVEVDEVALIVLTALGIAFLSTIYPALKAARLQPVEGLRFGG